MNSEFPQPELSTRRTWVKQFMLGSAATLVGPRWMGTVLADVTATCPGPAVIRIKAGDVRIQASVTEFDPMTGEDVTTNYDIAALAAPGGSVQYTFSSAPPFTLNRVETDRFVTLNSICTHNGCTVDRYKKHKNTVYFPPPMEPVTTIESYIECSCHFSRYDIEGRVIQGPALRDLARFETSYDAATDIVSVTIPELKLHINSIEVQQQGPGPVFRVKLVFPVTIFSKYEILYQENLEGRPTVVPFSTTPGGPANQTSVLTNFTTFPADGNFTAYVDHVGSRGFFVVGLVLGDVPSDDGVAP